LMCARKRTDGRPIPARPQCRPSLARLLGMPHASCRGRCARRVQPGTERKEEGGRVAFLEA
jgi:hypothetical protein